MEKELIKLGFVKNTLHLDAKIILFYSEDVKKFFVYLDGKLESDLSDLSEVKDFLDKYHALGAESAFKIIAEPEIKIIKKVYEVSSGKHFINVIKEGKKIQILDQRNSPDFQFTNPEVSIAVCKLIIHAFKKLQNEKE
jgi:hypothetical protein